MAIQTTHRPICEIAYDIRTDWKNVNYAAKPYLEAMTELRSIDDAYGCGSAKSIIRYFLCNASGWKGEFAKSIKAELNRMVK